MRGRLLECTLPDACSNLALEEALFRKLQVPTLRIWENQKSVVIGRAQLARFETDLDRCQGEGIPVVRRFTAGGAVYNGPGNLNWSFMIPRETRGEGPSPIFDAKRIFRAFADVVVRALAGCSVNCRYDPPNRIVIGEGKVSGMAAYISASGVICHGTLLVSADLKEVEDLTRPARVDAEKRYPRSRFAKVANCGVDRREFVEALAAISDVDYSPDTLWPEEEKLASTLLAERYSTSMWNLGDPFSLDYF